MSKPNKAGHYFSGKTCIECGLTRREAARQGGRCTGLPDDEDLDDDVVPEYWVLARPLAIVPMRDADDGMLGALLVSADDHTLAAAKFTATADTFDPDEAFRALDDLRVRAEMGLQWVEEGLAAPRLPPAPTKRVLPAWATPWLASGALAVAVLLAPASFIVEVGPWNYAAVTLLLSGWVGYPILRRAGTEDIVIFLGCLMALATAFFLGFAGLIGAALMSDSVYVAAHRLLLVLVGAFLFNKAYGWHRNRAARTWHGPVEYLLEDHEDGVYEPAAHYRPELIRMEADIHVAIECCAQDGRVLRLLALARNDVTREYVDEMVRMARERDDDLTLLRDEEREKESASAAALARLVELERVRGQLPDP